MEHETVEIRVAKTLADAARDLARSQDITLGQLVRDLLGREIGRRHPARRPVRADERLVAPLRARLAPDLAEAEDWEDLQARLTSKGYRLREAGGGLALVSWPADRRLCKASELGFSYSRLLRRFGAPFPGHAHRWISHRMLGRGREDDDESLIEPFD